MKIKETPRASLSPLLSWKAIGYFVPTQEACNCKYTWRWVLKATTEDFSKEIFAKDPAEAICQARDHSGGGLCQVRCMLVDGKDQALFCEGEGCNSWIHRYCGGVPGRYFEQLSSSSSPFYCFVCSLRSYADEISSLKSSLTSLIDDISFQVAN